MDKTPNAKDVVVCVYVSSSSLLLDAFSLLTYLSVARIARTRYTTVAAAAAAAAFIPLFWCFRLCQSVSM